MTKPLTSLTDLTPDQHNANLGTERGRAALEASLRRYGAGRSVLADKHGNLIAGNKTVEVAAELGLPIRVIDTDGHELVVVQRRDLDLNTDATARELAYADNRVAELNLDWNPELLAADVANGLQLAPLFTEQELADLTLLASPPSLDDLEEQYGTPAADTFWPEIRLRIPPEVHERYASLCRLLPNDLSETEQFARLLAAVDTALLRDTANT